MRAASTLTALGAALSVATGTVHAVGFGRITNATQLGQPLNFAAGVRLEPDESLARECVSAEVQSGENRLAPAQVRVTLEGTGDALERSVRVTTSALIDEPVVTVSVTIGCTSKVTRRFVAFIDPPMTNLAQTVPPEVLPPQRRDSQVSPILTLVEGENPTRTASSGPQADRAAAPRARARAASAPRPVRVAASETNAPPAVRPSRPRVAVASRQPSVARPAASGPRLQLETAAPVAVAAASAAASSPLTVAALVPDAASAASVPRPNESSEQLARERQRIQSLEESMAKLRSDAQATRAALDDLQLRLKDAEAGRYANPLVYGLAWLSALLALAVAGLWWRQSRARQSAQWWGAPSPVPAPAQAALAASPGARVRADDGDDGDEPPMTSPSPRHAPATLANAFAVSTLIDEDGPAGAASATRPAPFVATVQAPSSGPISVLPEMPRELSVEELIDLEQQAEFFIVLGQDEAAIELLMNHVRSDGGISPLPYLKLLEIYRRRGDEDAYERIRERFNRRFNAYAPDWNADLQQGRSLSDYPDTLLRLQQLWATPVRVMETLDASLFRRNKTDDTFDLPAYRELLFLYSLARDIAEHAGELPHTSVDLLLPLDDDGAEPISRLSATTQPAEFVTSDMMTLPLDLDVSFAPAATQDLETRPSALQYSNASGFMPNSGFVDFDLDAPAAPTAPKHTPKGDGNR